MLVSYRAASDALGKAAVFAVLLLAARRLPTASFGLFSLASTLGWILAVATDFGLQLHLARAISHAPERLSDILRPILRLRVVLGATALAIAAAPAFVWLPPAQATACVAIVAAYLISSLVELLNYVYRAVSRSELESTLNLLQRLATLALAALLLAVAPDLSALAWSMLLPPAIAFGSSLWIVRTIARPSTTARGVVTAAATAPAELSRRTFAREVLPIGLGIVLSALYFRIDLFLIEYWRGVEEVALYNAVFRLVEALRLFPAAVLAVLLPAVFRRRDAAFVWKLSGGLTAFGVAAAAVGLLLASPIVDLAYGPKYAAAVPVLRVLLLAFPLLSLNYGLTHQAIGWGAQRAYAVICGAALAVNVGANAVLIPRMGAVGAAWSTLGTEACLTIALVSVLGSSRSRASSWPAPSAIPTASDPAAPAPPRAPRP